MACACKVNRHIDKINKIYGKEMPTVKTSIKDNIYTFLQKIMIFLLYMPIIPFIGLFLLIRKIFTNKPIILDSFIKRKKYVRNK